MELEWYKNVSYEDKVELAKENLISSVSTFVAAVEENETELVKRILQKEQELLNEYQVRNITDTILKMVLRL